MKKSIGALLMGLLGVVALPATETLDLKDIVNGDYSAQSLGSLHPLNDGEHYAQLSNNKECILRYSFKTGQLVDTLFAAATARDCDFKKIDGYQFSPQEDYMLLQTKTEKIYRRSFKAEHYLYNVRNNKVEPLSKGGAQQAPLFSPDGKMVAFVRDNNLFLVKLLFNNSESQVTTDGKRNEVLNGIPDWVYEEEFAMNRFYEFSADSKMLAYVRTDERAVPTYSFPLYNATSLTDDACKGYPTEYTYKYPVSGATNATVTVHTFDIKSAVTRRMEVPLEADGYVPRIYFTSDPDQLAILTLNRNQNRMDLYMGNSRSTVCKLALREEAPQYIKEAAYQDLRFYPKHFILQSERDGHNHLYLYSLTGTLVKQLTQGDYEVTSLLGWDEEKGTLLYQSNEGSPLRTAVYLVDKKGKKSCLTPSAGSNSAIFSKNLQYYIHTYSNLTTPPVTTLRSVDGKIAKKLIDNEALAQRMVQEGMPFKELFSFTTGEGVKLNGWMVKPAQMEANRKYPVVLYQYSGPGSQEVRDAWNTGFYGGLVWESYLAQNGFVVVCVDGRGTGGRGAAFEKCTYQQLGLLEAKDQVEVARYVGSLPYVDKANIAIWGWSYGGFNTLMSMCEAPVFKAGVAVAPPTDWRFYDSVYTERFMRTPQENGDGYTRCSAMGRAANLHGVLLLIHGMADDNVHFRNSAIFAEALVQADKQFDMQVYTDRNHHLVGGNTRYHLFTRIFNFLKDNLQ